MTDSSIVARVAHVLSEKNSISICLPTNPTLDAVAAGTALYMALTAQGKNVGIAAPSEVNPEFSLTGQDKIQNKLVANGDNLVVSFPYSEGSVDKVTYNIEGEKFNLIIQPREGFSKLDPKQVSFSYSGGKPEVIVALYAPTLASLGQLHSSNTEQFTGVDIINIDRHFTNANFGSINYVDKKSSSMSEMILALIQELKVQIDKDMATNLYAGIATATNNFGAHSVTAETFESIALLLKSGAVKKQMLPVNKPLSQPFNNFQTQFGQQMPQMPGQMGNQMMGGPAAMQQPYAAQYQQFQQQPQMMQQPNMMMQPQQQPQMPQSAPSPEFGAPTPQPEMVESAENTAPAEIEVESIENKEVKSDDNPDNANIDTTVPTPIAEEKPKNTPKDWLKPKIFKGTNLV